MYRRIVVFYSPVLLDGDATFYSVCGETNDGKLETIQVVDVAERGGMKKVEGTLRGFLADGLPLELDGFAQKLWGQLIAPK